MRTGEGGDFFHVIEAARKAGISQADQRAILGEAEATEDEDKRGDFFHVIEAARKADISQADQRAIWG